MTTYYALEHNVEGRDGSSKLIGVFDCEQNAKLALDFVKGQPGFRDHLDGFLIDLYRINRISWEQGFGIDDECVNVTPSSGAEPSQNRASVPPAGAKTDPDGDYHGTYKTRIFGQAGKDAASNVPSWVRGLFPRTGESGAAFARRLMNIEYGDDCWVETGSTSPFYKIKNFGDRGFR